MMVCLPDKGKHCQSFLKVSTKIKRTVPQQATGILKKTTTFKMKVNFYIFIATHRLPKYCKENCTKRDLHQIKSEFFFNLFLECESEQCDGEEHGEDVQQIEGLWFQ
ncbi:uncharacterized protein LOC130662619 isoform X1 [Hydractinia symbiolongicarpus]|uniref:uncharacterized protein LOC130662619 isoform X1 n=1 Tax=Hydractinia symbiolongicarpus TaxID=13093 RepID=UPI0025513A81|nr:uncharacterized protein LOC130662619 isoform X1 [Hydractinia symbiolongicarpus]